jgi:phosphoketolase
MKDPNEFTSDDVEAKARQYRQKHSKFNEWASGFGVLEHNAETQVLVFDLANKLQENNSIERPEALFDLLINLDRLTSSVMWLVVHMTYARNVYLDGRTMDADDFKADPEGHTGGALNMVPAYTGYLAANAITNHTRAWIMGQGHSVAAIDAANVIADNMRPEHAKRYGLSDDELTSLVRDFYSYEIDQNGLPASPIGSHVNVHTAGGIFEGGYLGFAELTYAHMPEPGERMVAFLSDGAFEEQRGSDWSPRWWRTSDSGLITPIMIANGRRIDQRTTTAQMGGTDWLSGHLEHHHYDPVSIDGHDPAAFVWGILTMEERLQERGDAVERGEKTYPVRMPYLIAECVKGFGFPGAGTNRAHNLPLGENPHKNQEAREAFHRGAEQLHVPLDDVRTARETIRSSREDRPPERDHPLADYDVSSPNRPEPDWATPGNKDQSPMEGIDQYFVDLVKNNPEQRVRVGNPDEMRSNRLNKTLDLLKHRVTDPEEGVAESATGSVITALNEEAVVCSALGNRKGISLVHSYEAFGMKMLGALRQDLIFSRQQTLAGEPASWLSVPVLLSSHTWENGKNEQSHQDPTMSEALLGEMSDHSRVFFPPDWNTAVAMMDSVYRTRGQIWTAVVPKRPVPVHFSPDTARELMENGAATIKKDASSELILTASGSYQLTEVLTASRRLDENNVPHDVVYLQEPGRFRDARDDTEEQFVHGTSVRNRFFSPDVENRIFVTHCRPEPYIGAVRPLDTGKKTKALGYVNRGGTLDAFGMLYANRSTWAHILQNVLELLDDVNGNLLDNKEQKAVRGQGNPDVLRSIH